MNKYLVGLLVLLAGGAAGFFAFNSYIYTEKQGDGGLFGDLRDGLYYISGEPIQLTGGISVLPAAEGAASAITTRYFGNESRGDIDGDGDEDVAFLLTQEGGGSGTFFYLAAAIREGERFRGTNAMLIGDRIAPQTTEFRDGLVIVNYADRAPSEPMTARPSYGKSLYAKYSTDTNDFGEVVQNFEGEAAPAVMELEMKTWEWIEANYSDGETTTPKNPKIFTLTFDGKGRFSATTDCNAMSGNYAADDAVLSFGAIAMTKKFCDGSQEGEFASYFDTTTGYHFTSKGELILELQYDSGTVTFR